MHLRIYFLLKKWLKSKPIYRIYAMFFQAYHRLTLLARRNHIILVKFRLFSCADLNENMLKPFKWPKALCFVVNIWFWFGLDFQLHFIISKHAPKSAACIRITFRLICFLLKMLLRWNGNIFFICRTFTTHRHSIAHYTKFPKNIFYSQRFSMAHKFTRWANDQQNTVYHMHLFRFVCIFGICLAKFRISIQS